MIINTDIIKKISVIKTFGKIDSYYVITFWGLPYNYTTHFNNNCIINHYTNS